MSTLLVFDKPFVARKVFPYLPADIDPNDTYVAHTMLTGPARMHFVRGKKRSDYPLIAEPQFVLDNNPCYDAQPLVVYTKMAWQTQEKALPVNQLAHVERVVYAVDPDHSGIWAFRSALALWFGEEVANAEHEAWLFHGLDEQSIEEALQRKRTTRDLDSLYDYARTKRYFEYQWTNNAHAVLPHNGLGVPSKFGLQLLYFLRRHPGMSEDALLGCMQGWQGTGRYPSGGMGSPASRAALLAQLQQLGFVDLDPKMGIALSPTGHRFLLGLHPDSEDLDLPQRLVSWCEKGLAASQSGIDRYIRTVFGKQMRFAHNVSKTEH